MFDSLYVADERDRALFGVDYCGPERFQHGEWATVLRVPAIEGGDGRNVEIDECRMPARGWRLRVLAGKDSTGELRPAWSLSTGSGDEMGALCVQIAKAVSEGMLGFHASI